MALPNFLCIGAQRSGSTSLHSVLSQHPEVYLPRIKEQDFFNAFYHLGTAYYEMTTFAGYRDQKAIGEVTPEYLYDADCPQRIHDTLGDDVKLIICIRDPAERAYSQYLMYYNWFWENETFQNAVSLESERLKDELTSHLGYLDRGFYYKQISRYLEFFSKEQLFFIEFKTDWVLNQKQTLLDLLKFLDVNQDLSNLNLEAGRNNSISPSARHFAEAGTLTLNDANGTSKKLQIPPDSLLVLNLQGGLYPAQAFPEVPALPATFIRQPSHGLVSSVTDNRNNAPAPKIDPDLRRELNNDIFAEDIAQLEKQLDRDLSHWLE